MVLTLFPITPHFRACRERCPNWQLTPFNYSLDKLRIKSHHSRESGFFSLSSEIHFYFLEELASLIIKWIPAFGLVEKAHYIPDRRGNSLWLPCIYANI